MFVLVGLGNPGSQYLFHRHNIGFMAVDFIQNHYQFSPYRTKNNALISEGKIASHHVLLCKPQTYMNLSGQSVGSILRFLKIPTSSLYVFHDDLDLASFKIKVKCGGGHGGHNGLRSLDQHVGANYWRIRLGIGHPGHKDEVSHYVLSDFTKQEQENLPIFLDAIARHLDCLIGHADPAYWLNKVALHKK